MNTRPAHIFLLTALACEAKPLIDCFKLKKQSSITQFNIFINENIVLTVTGIGKTAMAAGVAYTQALFPAINDPVMLNIGVAGHQYHPIGSLFLADKITDNEVGKSYYPPFIFTPPCPTSHLITFAKPQYSYPESALCDMEGSAFYETATRFSTGELIHCLKIVSDNSLSPAQNVQPQQVSSIIADNMAAINDVLTTLTKLAGKLIKPELIDTEQWLKDYHFTASERIQLQKLLRRWRLVTGKKDINLPTDSAKNGKEFIRMLEQAINGTEFNL